MQLNLGVASAILLSYQAQEHIVEMVQRMFFFFSATEHPLTNLSLTLNQTAMTSRFHLKYMRVKRKNTSNPVAFYSQAQRATSPCG